jgi:fermentation-respiration switch protein FrsA (DUF1100 family)
VPELAVLLPILKRLVLYGAVAYGVVVLLAYLLQRRMMYLPSTEIPVVPAYATGLEQVSLTAGDGTRLLAWHWPGELPGTVVLFHGNAGHRGHRLHWMQRIRAMGYGAFVLDYRGYGGSEGSPTEDGLYQDGEAALAWVRERAGGAVVIAGSSIGGGVAVEMARRHPPRGLMLTNTAPSTTAIAKNAYPFLPVGWLLKDRFENGRKIAEVKCPVLVLHGEDDTIAPVALGRRLHARANEPKTLVVLPGVGHNDIWDAEGDAYFRAVERFLGETLGGR